MPDKRSHRGAHPEDAKLFAESEVPKLREAVADLSWLLGRGYTDKSALKLVGDRLSLRQRQRIAVMRCASDDAAQARRQERRCERGDVNGRLLMLDGYNVLTTVEAALADGVLLLGRDGCLRDMASMHGSFRKVQETRPAVTLLGQALAVLGAKQCVWLLDRPVSNSGRLKTLLEEMAAEHRWDWQVRVVQNPDKLLIETDQIVTTADSVILDRCRRWFNLARQVVAEHVPQARVVDLSM